MEAAEVLKGFDQQSHEGSWGQSAVVGGPSSARERLAEWAGPACPGPGVLCYCEGVGEPWKGPRQGQFWTAVEDGQETRRPGRKSGPRSRALNPISILMVPPQTTPLV